MPAAQLPRPFRARIFILTSTILALLSVTTQPANATYCGTWLNLTPAAGSPSARYGHAMTFDSARGVTILFGGKNGAALSGDTWEWNGAAWTNRNPAVAPSPRVGHSIVYDSTRGVTVLFGGQDANGFSNETWEWNGAAWSLRSPTVTPSPRAFHASAFDSARGVTVAFAGQTATGLNAETWEWDGTNWTQAAPALSPSPRSLTAMAFDTDRNLTVLFGGQDATGSNVDTWERQGGTWILRTPVLDADSGPIGPISAHCMAYDPSRHLTFLYNGAIPGDSWAWNGTSWLDQYPNMDAPRRTQAALAYDSIRHRMILFGGIFATSALSDTWEFNIYPPTITQPTDQISCGGSAQFLCAALAPGVIATYQWRRGSVNLINGGNISGANGSRLVINPVGPADAGTNYNCFMSSRCLLMASNNASLTLIGPIANAGGPYRTCGTDGSEGVQLSGSATNSSAVIWSSSGTGTFVNADTLSAMYYPSAADVAAGFIMLTLTANGNPPCGPIFAQTTLTFYFSDCNTNGTVDGCEPGYADCDTNGTGDFCLPPSSDCNTNLVPDLCEMPGHDCNTNGLLDNCEWAADDCNSNNTLDACELPIVGGGIATGSIPFVIFNNQTVFSNINAIQKVFVTDVNVQVDIRHAATGDLTLCLARLATTVTLASGIGGSGDNFARTVFDQQAPASIQSAAPPYAGTYRPMNSLNAFTNFPKSGIWTLIVRDTAAPNTGTLLSWSLITTHRLIPDCNTDGTPDICQLSAHDCNTNGSRDECEFDCNTNGTPDTCEIPAQDCDTNGSIDACEFDCNTDSIPDACQIAAADCNTDGIYDACQLGKLDCNTNQTLDFCETGPDCNTNRTPDACELIAHDCNTNGAPDDCDVATLGLTDCNTNRVPDYCEAGCNTNGTPDACELSLEDCNSDHTLDMCQSGFMDCNTNGLSDSCEIASIIMGTRQNLTPVHIRNNETSVSTQTLTGFGFIRDVDVQVNIRHTSTGQLSISIARLSTTVTLASGLGGTGDNYLLTVFDQQATTVIQAAIPPFWGTYKPQESLRAFLNIQRPGPWSLLVHDSGAGDTGTLLSWSIVTSVRYTSDCNTNGTPDICELTGLDCNTNNSLDDCEFDCNTNGITDGCELTGNDCNTNGTPDACDLDADHNGIPDDCTCQACPGDINADHRIDAADVAGWVRCRFAAPQPADACTCAGGLTDAQFINRLLNTAAGPCP